MAIIALTSAGGAPGVSTAALGLTLSWPRSAVLVDADAGGPSAVLAGYLSATVAPQKGIVDLVLAQRAGTLAHELPEVLIDLLDRPGQPGAATSTGARRWLLPGAMSHDQALAIGSIWQPLGEELRALSRQGQDAVLDLGRLGTTGFATPLLESADLVLLVVRGDLVSMSTANQWAGRLASMATDVRLLAVGDRHPYREAISERAVSRALHLQAAASLAWDPASAAVLSHGAEADRKFNTAPLARSLHAAAEHLLSEIDRLSAARDQGLDPERAAAGGFAAFRRRM
jgi:hypothetical protein